jgi:hypothetical protein
MSNHTGVCIVDTNVLLVANKQFKDATAGCVQSCARRLHEICSGGHIAVDDAMRIFNEYRNKTLKRKGQPEAGDEFVLWVITNLWNSERCTQVKLTPKQYDDQDFDEFPNHSGLHSFDRSDRVFVAVANSHPEHPPILAACDTDHWQYRDVLAECNVVIDFLCEDDVRRLATQKGI